MGENDKPVSGDYILRADLRKLAQIGPLAGGLAIAGVSIALLCTINHANSHTRIVLAIVQDGSFLINSSSKHQSCIDLL